MKDSNFRNGDAKTAIFGSEVMLTPSPVDKIPDGPKPRRSLIKWLKTRLSHKHSLA